MLANLLGCAVFFALVYCFQLGGRVLATQDILLALAAAMLPMITADIRRNRRLGLYIKHRKAEPKRILLKLLGLYATFALLLLIYWVLPEYHTEFYDRFERILHTALLWLSVFAVPYFAWMDARQDHPEDAYFHLGLLLTGTCRGVDGRLLAEHFKSWAVKGFFLPLMATYLVDNIMQLTGFDYHFRTFLDFYNVAYHFTFSVDLLFACTGYLMTLRLLNTQIYSAEPTALGWLVCLMCYQPLWGSLFYPHYFTYDDGYYWDHFVAGWPILRVVWGMVILTCLGIYAWATVAFGYRFSNLTYRGLITGGPYRFTKHPAYVFKCASWWLISVPFIASQGGEEALRQCLMLAGLCYLYFLRARTEENHLSNYPEYVEYALWMNTHGLFASLGRVLPFLAYDADRARRSHSCVYAPYAGRKTVAP